LAIGRQKICAFFKNFKKSFFAFSRAFWCPATAKMVAHFSKIRKSHFSQLSRACCLAISRQKICAFFKNFKKSFFAFSRAFWCPATAKMVAHFSKVL
ncbi:hypothetical protein T11_14110, partial [Trichinella zimbabwensis]